MSGLLASLRGMAFQERLLRPAAPLATDGWTVKRYELTVDGTPIAPDVLDAAEEFVPDLLPAALDHPLLATELGGTPAVAFSVLHQGKDAVWLNVYSWCYEAILHCRVAGAALAEPTGFAEVAEPLIGCVWELPVLVHERSAWVRHVLQPERPNTDGYLADQLPAGPVGNPQPAGG